MRWVKYMKVSLKMIEITKFNVLWDCQPLWICTGKVTKIKNNFFCHFSWTVFCGKYGVFANNILQNHQRILRRVFEISLIWFSFVSVLKENVTWLIIKQTHCMKSIRIRSFSGPHFLAFGSVFSPNPRKYGPETLQLRTPFTQWYKLCHRAIYRLSRNLRMAPKSYIRFH